MKSAKESERTGEAARKRQERGEKQATQADRPRHGNTARGAREQDRRGPTRLEGQNLRGVKVVQRVLLACLIHRVGQGGVRWERRVLGLVNDQRCHWRGSSTAPAKKKKGRTTARRPAPPWPPLSATLLRASPRSTSAVARPQRLRPQPTIHLAASNACVALIHADSRQSA